MESLNREHQAYRHAEIDTCPTLSNTYVIQSMRNAPDTFVLLNTLIFNRSISYNFLQNCSSTQLRSISISQTNRFLILIACWFWISIWTEIIPLILLDW